MRWQGGKVERMVRQKFGRYLVLFKDEGHQMSPRLIFLFPMLIKETKGWDGFKIFLRGRRDGKALLRSFTSC